MKVERFDVAIVGAGPAGIAAAVGAARQGARVVVIERREKFGGNATAAMVGTICGISRCGQHLVHPPRFDNPGFATEFSRRVADRSGKTLIRNQLGLTYLPYIPAAFEAVCREIVAEHPTVETITRARLSSINREQDGDPFSLCLTTPSDRDVEIHAGAVVDCSGDSAALKLLTIPTVPSSPPQAAALVFGLNNLPQGDEHTVSFTIRKILREATLEGALPEELSYLSIIPGSLDENTALFKLGVSASSLDDAKALGEQGTETLHTRVVASLETIISCVRGRGHGFQSISLGCVAPALGVRSGDRGLGEDELSSEAVRLSQRHIKGIALGLWPVEIWDSPVKPGLTFPDEGDGYEIPLGSLCAKGVDGVYFAGRAIAATDYAIGSARVIGTSLSTGYAAGWIAAGRLQGQSIEALVRALRAEQVDSFYRG